MVLLTLPNHVAGRKGGTGGVKNACRHPCEIFCRAIYRQLVVLCCMRVSTTVDLAGILIVETMPSLRIACSLLCLGN